MVCFSFPLEVSSTVPRGRRGSLASSFWRMVFRMLNVALWETDHGHGGDEAAVLFPAQLPDALNGALFFHGNSSLWLD